MKLRILAALMSLVLLTGCESAQEQEHEQSSQWLAPQRGGTLNLCALSPDTLNPLVTTQQGNLDLLYLVYEGLFCVEEDFSATPVLATDIRYDDGKMAVVTLRHGVQFHDGSAFTADDVVYTFEQIKQYRSIFASELENIIACRAVGEYEVEFTLGRPQPNITNLLDFPILPDSSKTADFASPNQAFLPIGTGRYRYESKVEYKSVTLVCNQQWYGGEKPYVERIRISYIKDRQLGVYSFDAGEVDLITTDLYDWGGQPLTRSFETVEGSDNRLTFVGINHENRLLSDRSVRYCLNLAIDKKSIVADLLYDHATAADVPVNPDAVFSADRYEDADFDPAKARQLLTDAGWMDLNGDGVLDKQIDGALQSLTFELLVNDAQPLRMAIANEVASAMSAVGMQIYVTALGYGDYLARVQAGNYELFLGEMELTDDCDPAFLLHSTGTGNYFGYRSEAMDRVIDRLGGGNVGAYAAFEREFTADYPFVCLYYGTRALLLGARIKGEAAQPRTSPYLGLNQTFLE